ncbi:MAG: glycoside hydrolase family protein [Nitrososphaera sp.]|nr:glycoside hydrolase family protein [Nitrososphaera sp.]
MYSLPWLRALLRKHEGYDNKLYKDSVDKWTIGIGWNIEDKGLPHEIIIQLLDIGIKEAEALLNARIPWWQALDDVRQLVLMDMAFNMGGRLFTFKNMLASIKVKDWPAAAAEMRASLWAKQVGKRAEKLAQMMETGNVEEAAK